MFFDVHYITSLDVHGKILRKHENHKRELERKITSATDRNYGNLSQL